MDPDNLPKFVYQHKNHKLRLKLGFYAAPSNPKLFSKAVRDELGKLKFTYCSDLNGLIMGFGKINSNELIQADTRHCISVAINVDVFIFRPPVGSVIEAVVNQTSDNHVSCLVHNLFNVSIVRPENQPCDQWSGSTIKKDDKINVKVLSFDLTKKLPHITGEIIDNETDECDIPKNVQDNYSEKSSSSEECDFTKSVEHGQIDDVNTSLKHLSSDSESSNEEMNMVMTRSQKRNIKSIISSTQLNDSSINNSKHIKNLFGNSTPISNSNHSLVNLNLMKNKQIEKLQKHLTKNSAEKRKKSLDSVKSHDHQHVDENNTLQLSNNSKGKDIKIDKQCAVLSDSGISGDDHRQNKFSNHSLFPNTSPKPSKTIEKLRSADNIVVAPLHSLSPNKNKFEANILEKLSADLNIDIRKNGNEKNNVYTQHTLGLSNFEDAMLNNYISPAKSTINKPTLRLSTTKIIEKNNSPKIQIENKLNKNHSNVCSMDSDSNSSEDIKLAITSMLNNSKVNEKNDKIDIKLKQNVLNIEDIKQLTNKSQDERFLDVHSSDEDEMYMKLKQNISKIEDETHTDKTQNETCLDSDDEIYTKLKQNISKVEDTKSLTEKTGAQKSSDSVSSDDDEMFTILKQNISTVEDTKSLTEKTETQKLSDSFSSDDDEMFTILKQNISTVEDTKSLTEKTETQKLSDSFSSDDDEMFTILKQNISKKVDIKPLTEKTQNQKLYNENSSDNESNSSNKLFQNTFLESKRSNKHDETSSDSMSETNNSNKKKTSEIFSKDSVSNNEVECTSNKNNTDEYQLTDKIVSDKVQTSNVQPNEKNSTTLNKETSNPFIKLYTENSTSSSSEDDIFITSSTKSKLVNNNSTKEKMKNELIQQFLSSSIKHKDKDKQRLLVENMNSDFSGGSSSNSKIKETKREKLTGKHKKIILKKLRTPIEELKPNTDDSTDDEIDTIKKIIEKQKLNLSIKTGIPEATSNQNKLKKHKATSDIKFDKKSSKITTDELTVRSKASILNKSRNPIEVLKPNTSSVNISQIDVPLQLKMQPHNDDSTDNEIDFIKQIIEKRKFNLSGKTDVPEVINQNKLKKINKNSDIKFDKKISRNSIEKPKSNTSTVNISQLNVPLSMKKQLHTDKSSDDENDIIKNILKKQKLNSSKKTGISNATNQTKLKKHEESLDIKFDKNASKNSIEKPKPHTNSSTDDEIDLLKKIIEKNKLNLSDKTDILEVTKKKKLKNNDKTFKSDTKSLEIPTDKSFKKNKNKSLKKLRIPAEEPKPNASTVKITQIDIPIQLKSQHQTDNSTDDEIDFIKKIAEKRKLNVIEKTVPEVINQNKLKKHKKSPDIKFDKKNKPSILNKLRNTIEKAKPNTSNVNISRIDMPLQNKTQYQTDNSTDDEIDFITKIAEKQKLNVTEKTDASEVTNRNKLKNNKEPWDIKLHTKCIKSSEITRDELIDDKKKTKRKRRRESKHFLVDSLLNAIDSSDSNPTPTKIKKKYHNSIFNTNNLLKSNELNFVENSSIYHAQTKYKEKNHDIINSSNEMLVENKINAKEDSSNIHSKIKKKKKSRSLINEINDLLKKDVTNVLEDSSNNPVPVKKKKKKNNRSLNNEINDLLKKDVTNVADDSSCNPTPVKKKKKNHSLINETKDLLEKYVTNVIEDSSSNPVPVKKKKKKNNQSLNNEINDLLKKDLTNVADDSSCNPTPVKKKKKKKNHSLINETKDLLEKYITNVVEVSSSNPTPVKKKKKIHSLNNEIKDLLKKDGTSEVTEDSSINPAPIKKKKKSHNLINEAEDLLKTVATNSVENYSNNHTKIKKKKKDQKLIIEIDDFSKDKDSVGNLSKVKKKKKKINHYEDHNLNDSFVKSEEQSLLACEGNISTNKPKNKVIYDSISTISSDKCVDKNYTSHEKTGSTKKKKKKSFLSKNNIESFLSTQNCEAINNLEYLYSSFNK